MLHYFSFRQQVKGDDICPVLEVRIAIDYYNLVQIPFLEAGIRLLDPLHEQGSICLLPFVDELVSNMILEQFEGKGGPIEAEEGGSACDLSVEDVHIVHHVSFGVAFHESHSAASREGWLCILDDTLSGY
jgi:hypothetical protein